MIVYAIIVTFNPTADSVRELVRSLKDGGASVIIVDNTPSPGVTLEVSDATVLRQGANTGIAHAQNVGIRTALERGAEVLVFFDQDSRPSKDFLPQLLRSLRRGEPKVVAPVCLDRQQGAEIPSYRLTARGLVRRVYARDATQPVSVDLVISSGSAATAAAFEVAGLMDEDLFIDYVDFEWCLRCRNRGVPILVIPQATISHSIGERSVDLGIFSGVIHSSARSYYKIRNGFLLARKKHVPTLFALRETFIAIAQYVAMLPFVKPRLEYAKVLVRAIGHGIRGTVGSNPAALRDAGRSGSG